MEVVTSVLAFFGSLNLGEWILAIQAFVGSALALALLVPGEQPDKFLQGVVDFVSKFSKK